MFFFRPRYDQMSKRERDGFIIRKACVVHVYRRRASAVLCTYMYIYIKTVHVLYVIMTACPERDKRKYLQGFWNKHGRRVWYVVSEILGDGPRCVGKRDNRLQTKETGLKSTCRQATFVPCVVGERGGNETRDGFSFGAFVSREQKS